MIRAAVAMPRFHLRDGHGYTVTGEPVLEGDLAGQITGSIRPLLVGAIVLMGLTLALAFAGSCGWLRSPSRSRRWRSRSVRRRWPALH